MQTTMLRYFPDRPVGPAEDTLWVEDDFREQLNQTVDTIVASLESDRPRETDSMTFAIYGEWGMGKSSALKIIEQEARLRADKREAGHRLHVCKYAAPYYEPAGQDVRVTLAMRIMSAIAGGPEQAVDMFLRQARAVATEPDTIVPGLPPQRDTKHAHAAKVLEEIARTLVSLADFEREIAKALMRVSNVALPADSAPRSSPAASDVLLVLIDDLDRCKPDFIWKVLNAIQQWSDVSNVFFVLAVAPEALRQSIGVHMEGPGAPPEWKDHNYALEKYIQHAVRVPPMDPERLDRFVKTLVSKYGADDPIGQLIDAQRDLIVVGLRLRTPRSVKRFLNHMRPRLERRLHGAGEGAQKTGKELKELILEYAWPDFFRHIEGARRGAPRRWKRRSRRSNGTASDSSTARARTSRSSASS